MSADAAAKLLGYLPGGGFALLGGIYGAERWENDPDMCRGYRCVRFLGFEFTDGALFTGVTGVIGGVLGVVGTAIWNYHKS